MLPLAAEFKRAIGYRVASDGQMALHLAGTSGSSARSRRTPDEQLAEFRVLEYLSERETVREESLRAATRVSKSVLAGMVRKKWIVREDVSDVRDATRTMKVALLKAAEGKLNSNQKVLIETLAAAFKNNPLWTLLDEQRVAFNLVRGHVERAVATGGKAVVIVVGGPGTGKSVIALNILFALTPNYRVVQSTASKAFTTNLRAVGPRGSESVFCWNRNFAHKVTEPNSVARTSHSRSLGPKPRPVSQIR